MSTSPAPSAARTFVDTSGFYALADRSDRHHAAARSALSGRGQVEWITTDHVMVETWLLVRARLGWDHALRFWDDLGNGLATVAGVSSADLVRARAIATAWRDQELSMVDCTSFAFIERLDLARAVAFDVHFRIYRWGSGRRRKLHLPSD
jgi:predicted nucleic acid-binding protein